MAADFEGRARQEALRYGSDPWVFVRELIQNSRDAGAGAIAITAGESGGIARVSLTDDGHGMDFEHARRYLFTLYASSKEHEKGAAGRFGVGFWSLLRFAPTRIVIRSWPRRGRPWAVVLDGALQDAQRETPSERRGHGTEIVLERPAGDGDLARRVRDAAWQSARYAGRRGAPDRPLDLRVNGESLTRAFELPAPSARFRKGRTRGVVALGPEARVELFAQGLRVRAASGLEDLLSPDGIATHTRVRFPALADGVAPQAILDGEDFEPLLARADVRETPALRRLVALSQRELLRLIERQVDVARPESRRSRWRLHARIGAAIALAAVLLWTARSFLPPASAPAAPIVVAPPAGPLAYRDLGGSYEGPHADALPASVTPLALRYEPADARPFFATLLLDHPLEPPPALVDQGPYESARCTDECLQVELIVEGAEGPLRLPVPTGHRVDPTSVRLGSEGMAVRVSQAGEPFIDLPTPTQEILSFRTAPASEASDLAKAPVVAVPAALAAVVHDLRALPPADRTAVALDWVRTRIRYATDARTVARHRALEGQNDLASRALAVGAADCDVQNAVLATILQGAGTRARMAVGYVGAGGIALSPLHAWVETHEPGGPWRVEDASAPTPTGDGAPPAQLPPLAREAVLARAAERAPADTRGALLPAVLAAGLVGAAALATFALRQRTHREVHLAPTQDIAALLRGALQRPDAFRQAPALYERKLLPTLAGGRASLAEASHQAARRQLFRSRSSSGLARQAAHGGATVLDVAHSESAAVADALGAVDLDEWDTFLRRCRQTPLLLEADRRLRHLGEPWSLRVAAEIGPAAVLDLPVAGGIKRIVVLDAHEPWLVAAEARQAARPAEAILAVVDRVAEILRLEPNERHRVVRPLAREAIHEAAR